MSSALHLCERYLSQQRIWIPYVTQGLDDTLGYMSDFTGVDDGNLRVAFALLLQYPIALGFLLALKNASPMVRHLYSAVTTTVIYGIFFDLNGLAHFYLCFFVCYTLLRVSSPRAAAVSVFVYSMAHLSYVQLARQLNSYGHKAFDHTAPFMVLVMKLTQLGWNYYDGSLPASKLNRVSKLRALKNVPSLSSYLGYLTFSPSFLVGPCFDYSEYVLLIESRPPFDQRPSSVLPALKTLAKSLAFMAIFAAAGPSQMFTFVGTKEYQQQYSIAQKLWFFVVAAFVARAKFYGGFKMSEGACILAGIGWNGYAKPENDDSSSKEKRRESAVENLEPLSAHPAADPSDGKLSPQWNRVAQVNVRKLETATCFRDIISNWNIQTANWLKYYVYLRVSQPGSKSSAFAICITYLVSAIWHGFYPGYYLTFVTGALCTISGNKLRRALRPWAYPHDSSIPVSRTRQAVYNTLGWMLTQAALYYAVAPFLVLTLPLSIAAWQSVHYGVHVAILLLFLTDSMGLISLVRRYSTGGRSGVAQFRQRTISSSTVLDSKRIHIKSN